MPINNSTSYFIKNEANYSINSNSFSNYTMLGGKYSGKGNFEFGLALKENQSSFGGFTEAKYTSPKIGNSNWSAESRTRVMADKPYDGNNTNFSMTQRLAAKGSWNLGKGWSIYEIAGVNSKISLQGDGLQSLTPTSITGIGYNINKKLNVYTEGELSKTYSVQDNSWDKLSPSVYLGAKYTF